MGATTWKAACKVLLNCQKRHFLGCTPMTTGNFLWCDCQTDKTKIATHGRFNKRLSDSPLEELPPNVNHLLRSKEGNHFFFIGIQEDTANHRLRFHVAHSTTTCVATVPKLHNSNNCSLTLTDDSITKSSCVTVINKNSSAGKIIHDLKSTVKKI